jgi:hypothetical protein
MALRFSSTASLPALPLMLGTSTKREEQFGPVGNKFFLISPKNETCR